MSTDTVTVAEDKQEPVENIEQEAQTPQEPQVQEEGQQEEAQEQQVPLTALQKERRKRQEAEQELKIYREHQLKMMQEKPQEEDESAYEPVTRGELEQQRQAMIRDVEEKSWIRQNPEKAEIVNEKLANFLKKKPHLARAIEAAPNRYEEAWELMDKLTPKQKAALSQTAPPKKEAPNSPSGMPKAAAMNQIVDVMTMTDAEYREWRNSKRSRR